MLAVRHLGLAGKRGLSSLLRLAVATGLAGANLPAQEAEIFVTVVDERTGEPATGLGADRFAVKDGDTTLRVVSVREPKGPLDVLLLVDASILGEAVRPMAGALVEELGEGETMAVVAYDESAELIQDFTSDKQTLRGALDQVQYRSLPRVNDAVFASVDGGFSHGSGRRAVILLSNGVAAPSRVSEAEVLESARAKQVSVFAVFDRAASRSLFRRLALRTGGATFAARRLKLDPRQLATRVFAAVRSLYRLAVTGVYTFGDRIEATVVAERDDKRKLVASALAVD